jgi:hypothetical protein
MVEAGKGTYEGKKGTDLIEEKIDEVILRALGLQEVFDLDYDTYKTLLKERMMADRMGQKMDSGEADAVTEEYKRVKTKAGRFRLKTEKIKSDSFRPKTKTGSTAPITDVTKLIPGSAFADVEKPQQIMLPPKKESSNVEKEPKADSKEETKKKKSSSYNFSKIESILDDIAKNLKSAFSFEKDKDKKRNQEEGRKKKKQKESTLEKTMGVVAKIGKKILEPLKGPLDYILNWITYTFLGKVVNNLLNWMSDPANTKKMMSIGRFLEDWWPALVGAYLIFGTSLGRFVSRLAFTIGAFSIKMLTKAIPALLNVIRTNPLAAAAVGGAALFTAGATIPMLFPDTVDEQEKKTDKAVKEKGKDNVKSELERKANNPNFFERLTGQDSEAKEQLYRTETGETKSYRRGGKITSKSGTRVKGAGADTQLIAAQPGEVVINKPAVDALGAPFFLGINKKYGGSGANKPKMAKGVQTASGGGLVVPAFKGGGEVGGRGVTNSGGGGSSVVDNIVKFVKQKIGYDVDKPETWGASFSSVFADKSSGSKPPKSKGKGFDFIATAQGLANQGMGLAKSATDPRSYQGLANQGQGLVNRGGGFKMPNLPSGGGMPGGLNPEKYIPEKYRGDYNRAKETVGGGLNPEKYIPEKYRGDYNRAKETVGGGLNPEKYIPEKYRGDYKRAKETVGGVINKGKEFVGGIRQNVINEGYLSKRGFYEGAAKAQGNNFLSELLPNLPGVSAVNKAITEEKLTKMGLGRDSNNIFINKEGKKENFTTAFYGGSSGIDRSHNVGQAQVNKMSEESRKYYLKKVKAGLRDGTLKSGELINAYDLDAKNPIRREQGTVRFFVGPDGSPYLTDTYGFDPGQVDLASEQAKYDQQVKEFRDPKTMMGRISKMLGLKPLADATEGGSKVQFALALRNKIFGYDPEDEAKAKLGMRFKTKVQIEELRKNMTSEEIDQLLKLSKDQLSLNERTALEKVKKKNQKESKKKPTSENQKKLEEKRPWWDKFGMFGGASAEIQRKKSNPYTAPGGIGPTISRPSKPNSRGLSNIPPSEGTRRGGPSDIVPKSNQQRLEEKRPWWDKFGMFGGASAQVKKKQGGGINESSGTNIPGAAADRQLIATQPGEYVLPVDAVMKMGGVHKIDQLVASLDSNSNAAKMLGTRKPIPGPPSAAGRSGMMTLPPITGGSGAGGAGGGGGGGSRKGIPSFSATSSYSGERSNKASIYGIK